MLSDAGVEVVDIAVPPDIQLEVIREVVRHPHIRGILAQKPVSNDYRGARRICDLCAQAGITLAVNQNMRYDQSVRACKSLLDMGKLGDPVLATVDMRAIPHWMHWQERLGWVTLRIMSIHHLDTFRFWFGDPLRVFASVRPDPRTSEKFDHTDGICLYILEYSGGLRCAAWDDVWAGPSAEGSASDIYIRWRVEGTDGMARGTISWPSYPARTPSTLDFTTRESGRWDQPRWKEVWFPDACAGPMADLLCALEEDREPQTSGEDHLKTMAFLDLTREFGADNLLLVLGEYIWQKEVIPPQDQWAIGVANVAELGRYAEGLNLEIVLELEPFKLSLVNTVDTMRRFLDDVDQPDVVRANCDISHLYLMGIAPAEVEALEGRIGHVHLSDCNGKVHGDLPPGRGVVPIQDYLARIGDTGFNSTVSIELEYSPQPERIVEWVEEAYTKTDALMQELGCRDG